MNRQQLINQVKAIILKHSKPDRIWLYGSEALGTSLNTSDIDIAFYAPVEDDHKYLMIEEIDKLSTLIKVDLSNLHQCDERFINRVKATGKVIYSGSKNLRAEDAIFNFGRALTRLNELNEDKASIEKSKHASILLDVMVKRFEFTFEMSWKAIKRTLSYIGIESNSPRSCFKEAFQQGWLQDEIVWLDMIEMRNLTSHTYDESQTRQLLDKIDKFLVAFNELYALLEKKLSDK